MPLKAISAAFLLIICAKATNPPKIFPEMGSNTRYCLAIIAKHSQITGQIRDISSLNIKE